MLTKNGEFYMLDGYTSANNFPWKLLQCKDAIVDGRIKPYHLQFSPTNKCNGNCSWCSCKNVDRSKEMPIDEIKEMLRYFALLGTKAITITGGGEPTLHPDIVSIMQKCIDEKIEIGMVSNGLRLSTMNHDDFKYFDKMLTWLRMSIIDTVGEYDVSRVERVVDKLRNVNIGISFTCPKNTNVETAKAICRLIEKSPGVTHIRFVQNILEPNTDDLAKVKEACESLTQKAIFQFRNVHTKGNKLCYLSKLKPSLTPEGFVYPCCGVQYATETLRELPKDFIMCHWSKFHLADIFDGSRCIKCYYKFYNESLDNMVKPIEHKSFV
jgi:MoaA/NifB/PqqE/SkfB family radical SAM enzyme